MKGGAQQLVTCWEGQCVSETASQTGQCVSETASQTGQCVPETASQTGPLPQGRALRDTVLLVMLIQGLKVESYCAGCGLG